MFLFGESRSGDGGKKNASKFTADEAVAKLANMKNEDKSRKYSYWLDNSCGPLPTEAYVKALFSRRKREGAKVFKKKNLGDEYDKMDIVELRERYIALFGEENISERVVLIKLLEIDDVKRYGSSDDVYEVGMNDKELKIQCSNRQLPSCVNEIALRIVMRGTKMGNLPTLLEKESFLDDSTIIF